MELRDGPLEARVALLEQGQAHLREHMDSEMKHISVQLLGVQSALTELTDAVSSNNTNLVNHERSDNQRWASIMIGMISLLVVALGTVIWHLVTKPPVLP